MWWLLILLGALGGALAGLLGIGGGVVYVLILETVLPDLGVPVEELHRFVIANSLGCVLFASLSANVEYVRQKVFPWKAVFVLGVPASFFALLTLRFIVQQSFYSKESYDVFIVLLLVYMVYKVFTSVGTAKRDVGKVKQHNLFISGALGGIVASLSGFGGGVVMVPLLNGVFKVNIKQSKMVSLGVISIMSLVLLVYNLLPTEGGVIVDGAIGLIFPKTVLLISIGVVIASNVVARWSSKFKPRVISIAYITFMLLFVLKKVVFLFS